MKKGRRCYLEKNPSELRNDILEKVIIISLVQIHYSLSCVIVSFMSSNEFGPNTFFICQMNACTLKFIFSLILSTNILY